MEGLPRGQPGSGASEVTWQKKIQGRVTFFDALPLKTPEAQASDNSLLVFIQQGRVVQRGDPLLLCTVACLLSDEQCLLDDAANQLLLAQAHGG